MRSIDREIVGDFIFSNDEHMLLGKSKAGGVYPVRMPKPAAEIPLLSGDDFTGATWVPVKDLPTCKLVETTKARLKEMGLL